MSEKLRTVNFKVKEETFLKLQEIRENQFINTSCLLRRFTENFVEEKSNEIGFKF